MIPYDEGHIFGMYPLAQIAEAFDQYRTPGLVKGKILIDCEQ